MLRSDEINELAAALSKAQAEMRAAEQDRENPHFRSKYATLASVWDACREPLTRQGLAVIQTIEGDTDPGKVVVVTTLLHASGQWVSSPLPLPVTKQDPQGYGSAITYGRRYSLAAMVGVTADAEDDDGNAAGQGAKAGPAQAPRQRAVAERVAQATEREGSYAGATGAKAAPKARETAAVPESSGDEAAACATARGAFFATFKEHFGDVERDERHRLLNLLLQPKAPITTQEGWTARHFIRALEALDLHSETCDGSPCRLQSGAAPESPPAEDEPAAPTPDAQQPAQGGHGAPPAGAAVCSVPTCGKALTKPQMQVSRQQFGVSLCPSCQKERKAEAAGSGYSG